jgi:hypothetical protein
MFLTPHGPSPEGDGKPSQGLFFFVSDITHSNGETFLYIHLLHEDVMGLFGPSKSELQQRIDELESHIEAVEDRAMRAENEADAAYRKVDDYAQRIEEKAENAVTIAHALNELHVGEVEELEDKNGTVEVLDEPRIAWKATSKHVLKLLLPEGAKVVHPEDSRDDKKRGDQAIPLAFYDVEQETFGDLYAEDEPTTTVEDRSQNRCGFEYNIGEKATPEEPLNTDIGAECRSGIHFFASKGKAFMWYKNW